jgi:luciferase family oxidoreductase group 1
VRFSILDFFNAPGDSVALAEAAEALGYHRYWLGEHHAKGQCPNPMMVGSLIAGYTERIRVGTGAVSMMLRNPLLIAEDAQIIDHFFPGRFDLGVAPGLAATAGVRAAVWEGRDPDRGRYAQRVRQLHTYLSGRLDPSHPLDACLHRRSGPALWLMGVNADAAAMAGELGVGFCSSFHHGGTIEVIKDAFARYRDGFKSSSAFPEPSTIVVVSGVCAPSAARVAELEATLPDDGVDRIEFIGTPDESACKIRGLADAVGADEAMILCQPTGERRANNQAMYEALSEAWALSTTPVCEQR